MHGQNKTMYSWANDIPLPYEYVCVLLRDVPRIYIAVNVKRGFHGTEYHQKMVIKGHKAPSMNARNIFGVD